MSRPLKEVDLAKVRKLILYKWKAPVIANTTGIAVSTIRTMIREMGLSKYPKRKSRVVD